jgi:DDE superfamily endonuclease
MRSPPPTPLAARQYSGTLGGSALCQVAVTLTFATSRGHRLIDRALYLRGACAADDEHRELTGVPEEVMLATKPELAEALLQRAHQCGIQAAFVAGDEGMKCMAGTARAGRSAAWHGVCTGRPRQPRPRIGSGRTLTAAQAAKLIPRGAWQRRRHLFLARNERLLRSLHSSDRQSVVYAAAGVSMPRWLKRVCIPVRRVS